MTTGLTTNKVAAAAIVVAMSLSFALVTPAKAQSVEDLTAQIASLLATITSLQAQLAGMTGGTAPAGSYNFTLNHEMGDEGGEVMDIQKFMNAQGFAVSATGAGSPGNETSYFGSRTKQAVVAWQNANAAAVLTPVGLTSGTGYWGPSSRSAANSMGGGSTTTPVPTGTGVTVSAAAQPANGIAVEGAARVPYTKFVLTNNSGSAQTINSVTVERGGLLNNLAIAGVVLLDQNGMQLGNARVLNSVDQATIGTPFTLNAGESRTFTVAANMNASLDSYAGEVGHLSVVAVNTSATVAGSLPITGASHTNNATLAIGSVTAQRGVEDPAAAASKEIGTTGYTFTSVKLTNSGSAEDVRLHSIRFDQAGSASGSDIVNVMAYVDGVAYAPVIDGDVYTFAFGSGIIIKEGLSKEVVVKGDIAGGTNRTISFNVYKYTDISVSGETYGYGLTATDGGAGFGSSTPAYDASDVTITAGTFNSVSKSNAAPSANIAIQTSDQILGAFTVDMKGESVTVQTVTMVATIAGGPVGTDLDNVTLVNQNGVVLAGPVDATGDATGDLSFASVTFPVGVTTLYVKGYLDATFGSADTIIMSTTPSNWTDATGDTTGDTVTLPSSTATANTMTVQAATLSATTLTQPAARSIVPGTVDMVWATASLDAANSGEDVRVTSIAVEEDAVTGLGTEIDNVEIWANLSGGTTNDSVRGDVYETQVADAEQMTGTTGANVLTMGLETHIVVAKNTSVGIAIVADLSSSASASDTHTFSIDTDSGDVTAVGAVSGTTVTLTPSGDGQTMTVAAAGDVTLTIDSSTPVAGLFLDTTTQQTSAVFRLAANNVEDVDIDSIKLTSTGTDDAVASYHFWVDGVEIGSVAGGQNTAEVFFADSTLVIPADSHKLVTVKVVMNPIDGTQVSNADTVITTIAASGDVDGTGMDSGTAIDPDDTSVAGNTHTMYETYPSFAFDNAGVSTVLGASANYLAGKIVITNTGDKDVTFDSTGELTLQVEVSGTLSTSTQIVKLEKSDGTTLDTVDLSATTGSAEAVILFADSTLTVPAGNSETVSVRINTGGLTTDGNTIQVWLSDDTDDNIEFAVDGGATDYSEAVEIFRGDIYGPTHVNP